MNIEKLTQNRKYIHAKDDGASHKEHSHLVLDKLVRMSMDNIGLILDFDAVNLKPASEKRLRDTMHNLLVIRHKNRMLKEKNT